MTLEEYYGLDEFDRSNHDDDVEYSESEEYMGTDLRDIGHWKNEEYTQRMTSKEWKSILLAGDDTCITGGRLRKLRARDIGAGIVEVYKEKLAQN